MSREIEPPYRARAAGAGAARGRQHRAARRRFDGRAACRRSRSPRRRSRGPQPAEERGAVYLRADRLEGNAEKTIEASGKVELRTRRETVLADWLRYDVANDEIWAKGDVTLRKGLDWISGPEVKFQREREIGYFDEPRFYISENQSHGEAKEIRFAGPDLYEASKAQYTSCVAPNNDWYLRSDEIEVDKLRKVGTAHDASVYFLGVPVMYTPWLEFPLSNERKSGFLTPTIGSTQIRGFEVSTPYYFNLAPNYDATRRRRALMTRRGLQICGPGPLPVPARRPASCSAKSCPTTASPTTTRWAVSWKHNQQLLPWLSGYVNYNRVSDSTYLADFADRVAVTSQKTLPEEAGLNATLRTADRARARAGVPDAAGPESRRVRDPAVQHAAAGQGGAERDRLARAHVERHSPSTRDFSQSALNPTGDRATLFPSLRWIRAGQRVVRQRARRRSPRGNTTSTSRSPAARRTAPSVAVPVASLDAGLVFERDCEHLRPNFVQTLEPRAMYTYIPFRNQNQLPVFDTVQDDFNFTQLFSENRFIGGDRVGDTNQLALAVTSRLLDPATGAERFRLAVGQRFYFEDQQVNLPGTTPQKAGSSDFLVGAEGRLSDAWSIIGLLQYDFGTSQFERFNVGTRYNPAPGQGAEPHLPLLAGTRRPDRRSIAAQADVPVGAVAAVRRTGRSSGRGTTRSRTARRWRRWPGWSTMAGAGRCASSGSS